MNKMKYVLYLFIAVFTVSCIGMGKTEYYVNFKGPVDITHVNLPDTINAYSYANIDAVAQAYTDCWSNLGFVLTQNTPFEYSLEAFGTYESFGVCGDKIISADTTINLQLTQPGLYKFNFFMKLDSTVTDTLIVR